MALKRLTVFTSNVLIGSVIDSGSECWLGSGSGLLKLRRYCQDYRECYLFLSVLKVLDSANRLLGQIDGSNVFVGHEE